MPKTKTSRRNAAEMPHNLDAEAALLGCLLMDEAVQSDILESLREEDFYAEPHRLILLAMKKIFADRKTVDTVTLLDQLSRDGTLERAGGLQSVNDLASLTPSTANYKQYLDIIKRDSVNRSLIRAAQSIVENCRTEPDERDALGYAEKLVYDISKQEDKTTLTSFADGAVLQKVIRKFEEIDRDPNAYRGLETGFTRLDKITHGLQKGNLIIIAARPGMGKTSLAMNIVEHACLAKDSVAAVFSLEMPYEEIAQRLICAHAEVSMERALSGQLAVQDWKNLLLAEKRLKESKIYIDDSSSITPPEILSKCRRLAAAEGRLDLVMIDYIQLMQGDRTENTGKDFNRQQEIASITRFLKIMAKELEVPVIALSQLRRIETKEPQLSDLRESGAIEQDADIVMFINRPDVNAKPEDYAKGTVVKGAAELTLAKHRNGSLGRIQLRFIGETTKFIDVEDQGRPNEEPIFTHKNKKPDGGDEGDEGDIPFDGS